MLQRSTYVSGLNYAEFHKDRFDAKVQNSSSEDPEPAAVWLCSVLLCSEAHSDRKHRLHVQNPAEH